MNDSHLSKEKWRSPCPVILNHAPHSHPPCPDLPHQLPVGTVVRATGVVCTGPAPGHHRLAAPTAVLADLQPARKHEKCPRLAVARLIYADLHNMGWTGSCFAIEAYVSKMPRTLPPHYAWLLSDTAHSFGFYQGSRLLNFKKQKPVQGDRTVAKLGCMCRAPRMSPNWHHPKCSNWPG